jgi:hypothetical protein
MSLPIPPWPTDESQSQQPEAHLDNIEPNFATSHPLDFDLDVFFGLANAENLSLDRQSGAILNDEDLMSTDIGNGSGSTSRDAMANVSNLDPFLENEFGFDITFPEFRNDLSEVMVHSSVFANL